MSSIKYCQKCHLKKRAINFNEAKKKMTNINEINEIETNCNSMCGPGQKKFIAQVSEDLLISDDFDELLKQIEESYEN